MKWNWAVPVIVSILILGGMGFPQHVFATLIYESATLGSTGQSSGFGINSNSFLGSRFSIIQTVEVSAIGGHMSEFGSGGDVFGAIVDMSGPIPAGSPFTGGEVLASTVFFPGSPSSDVSVPLSVTLPPGDYAIIFGSSQFGATGTGVMISSQPDTPAGSGSYFFWNGGNWQNGGFSNIRFTLNGLEQQTVVGGTALPIDTTSLLVAGAQTTTPWLILGVLSAVGIGLAVFTLKRSR